MKRKRFIDTLLDHFWSRWCKEYLNILRENQRRDRGKALSSIPNVNDVVIVYEEKMPRQLWRLGRIVKLLISNDGQVRGAEVKIGKTNSIIRRPVNKLYPLITAENNVDSKPFCNKLNETGETDETGEAKINKRQRRNAAILGDIRRKTMK